MNPEIKILPEKKLIGMRLKMNLAKNQTFELWHKFMSQKQEIKNTVSSDLFSVQEYNFPNFSHFTPHTLFYKWAATEVSDFSYIPQGMEPYTLTGGSYAVYIYKGTPENFAGSLQNILNNWLPFSRYTLDNSRPHFEILGDKYKNNDPNSEEEIWIPVKHKD